MDIALKTVFEEKIPQALTKRPELAREINAVVHFDIAGPAGGKWTLDLTKASDWVSAGHSGTPVLTFSASDSDMVRIMTGELNGQMAVMTGKLKLKPLNVPVAMKLSQILSAGRKEVDV